MNVIPVENGPEEQLRNNKKFKNNNKILNH